MVHMALWSGMNCGANEPTTMPAKAASTPASCGGKASDQGIARNSSQTPMPSTAASAPCVVARCPVQAAHQRHEGPHQRHLVGARHQFVDRRALHADGVGQHAALNTSTVMRIVMSVSASLMPGGTGARCSR